MFCLFKQALTDYRLLNKNHLCHKARPIPNDDFLYWFIGFTEGDGCFLVTSRGNLEFIITQATHNRQVLERIHQELAFGCVIKQGKRTMRFIVRQKDHLCLLIHLFNGNLVLPSRKTQFKRFLNAYNSKQPKKMIQYRSQTVRPCLNNTWLLGFTEAEGCFTCNLLKNSVAFRTRFIVCQKHNENLPVLSAILLLFGSGRLEAHHQSETYCFIVSGLKNVHHIYSYFDTYVHCFIGVKKQSYLKFKFLNRLFQMKLHLSPAFRPYLMCLSQKINSAKRKQK